MSMGDLFCKIMGVNLGKIQDSLNMTDDELCGVLDITNQELNDYKNGTQRIHLDLIVKLEDGLYNSESLNIIDDLLEGVEEYSNIMKVSEPEKQIIINLRNMANDKERWICGEVISLICGKGGGASSAWSAG